MILDKIVEGRQPTDVAYVGGIMPENARCPRLLKYGWMYGLQGL